MVEVLQEAGRDRRAGSFVPATFEGDAVVAGEQIDQLDVLREAVGPRSWGPGVDSPHFLIGRCSPRSQTKLQPTAAEVVDGLRLLGESVGGRETMEPTSSPTRTRLVAAARPANPSSPRTMGHSAGAGW